MSAIIPKSPRTELWVAFKVGSKDRLQQLQDGLLYMNSLEYFSRHAPQEDGALRKDEFEETLAVWRAGKRGDCHHVIEVTGPTGESISLGESAVARISFPDAANTMLFCMGALADGLDGKIPGEEGENLHFDKRFLGFGDHVLLITSPRVFSDRLNSAIADDPKLYSNEFLGPGYGLVDYVDIANESGPLGLFKKDLAYSWQSEFRIALCVKDEGLNSKGAYEFSIGSIEDISTIIPLDSILKTPLKIKRRSFVNEDGTWKQV